MLFNMNNRFPSPQFPCFDLFPKIKIKNSIKIPCFMEKVQQKREQVKLAPLCEVGTKPTTNQTIRFATLCLLYATKHFLSTPKKKKNSKKEFPKDDFHLLCNIIVYHKTQFVKKKEKAMRY